MTVYVGIDPSLTGCAIAIIDTEGRTAITRRLATTGRKGATLADRAKRIDKITRWAYDILDVEAGAVAVLAIESPAHNQTAGSHHDRSGLWWAIARGALIGATHVIEVTPQTLKKYATGKGNSGKDEVVLAVARRYPEGAHYAFGGATNDEADAHVLAAIAARLDGHPIEDALPQGHLHALEVLAGWEARS